MGRVQHSTCDVFSQPMRVILFPRAPQRRESLPSSGSSGHRPLFNPLDESLQGRTRGFLLAQRSDELQRSSAQISLCSSQHTPFIIDEGLSHINYGLRSRFLASWALFRGFGVMIGGRLAFTNLFHMCSGCFCFRTEVFSWMLPAFLIPTREIS